MNDASRKGGESDGGVLVKLPNWIGDCVMATPALAALRAGLPGVRIVGLARGGPGAVLGGHPCLDELLFLDIRKLSRDEWRDLRARRFSAVVDLTNSLRTAFLFARLSISVRVGYSRNMRGPLLTHGLAFRADEWLSPTPDPVGTKARRARAGEDPANPRTRHMVDYYFDLAREALRALGADDAAMAAAEAAGAGPMKLAVPPDAVARVDSALASLGVTPGTPLVGLNPGAAYGNAKRWPVDRLAAAGAALLRDIPGAALVAVSGPGETAVHDLLEHHLTALGAPLCRMGPELGIQGVAALMDRLAVFVGNDSGALHIAAARGTPAVAVFGPTDWNSTFPRAPHAGRVALVRRSPPCAPCMLRECPLPRHLCMEAVEPAMVVEAARAVMSMPAVTPALTPLPAPVPAP